MWRSYPLPWDHTITLEDAFDGMWLSEGRRDAELYVGSEKKITDIPPFFNLEYGKENRFQEWFNAHPNVLPEDCVKAVWADIREGEERANKWTQPTPKLAKTIDCEHPNLGELEGVWRCLDCEEISEGTDLIPLRECPHCDTTFASEDRACPNCNRTFSRTISQNGCPQCEEAECEEINAQHCDDCDAWIEETA